MGSLLTDGVCRWGLVDRIIVLRIGVGHSRVVGDLIVVLRGSLFMVVGGHGC